jgi:hypothetical protein
MGGSILIFLESGRVPGHDCHIKGLTAFTGPLGNRGTCSTSMKASAQTGGNVKKSEERFIDELVTYF